jgi:hypothetical protein
MPGFMDVINKSWNGGINHAELCQRLFHKLKKTKKVEGME